MLNEFLKKIKIKNNQESLRDKFEILESKLSLVEKKKPENIDAQIAKEIPNPQEFLFIEEIPWWEDKSKFNEIVESQVLTIDYKNALKLFKGSELYLLVGKNESLKLETLKNNNESSLLITWDSDFMDLSERRKYIQGIKNLKIDLRKSGIDMEIIHNHKRLGISNNIGVKIHLVEFEKNKNLQINEEFGELGL